MGDMEGWREPSRYFESLGMRLLRHSDGRAVAELPFMEAFGNRKGDVHGGAIAGLIDIAMSEAIRSTLPDVRGLSTISITVNYLDVGRGDLTGEAQMTRCGKTTAFASAEVRDGGRKLVATGQGVFRIVR